MNNPEAPLYLRDWLSDRAVKVPGWPLCATLAPYHSKPAGAFWGYLGPSCPIALSRRNLWPSCGNLRGVGGVRSSVS